MGVGRVDWRAILGGFDCYDICREREAFVAESMQMVFLPSYLDCGIEQADMEDTTFHMELTRTEEVAVAKFDPQTGFIYGQQLYWKCFEHLQSSMTIQAFQVLYLCFITKRTKPEVWCMLRESFHHNVIHQLDRSDAFHYQIDVNPVQLIPTTPFGHMSGLFVDATTGKSPSFLRSTRCARIHLYNRLVMFEMLPIDPLCPQTQKEREIEIRLRVTSRAGLVVPDQEFPLDEVVKLSNSWHITIHFTEDSPQWSKRMALLLAQASILPNDSPCLNGPYNENTNFIQRLEWMQDKVGAKQHIIGAILLQRLLNFASCWSLLQMIPGEKREQLEDDIVERLCEGSCQFMPLLWSCHVPYRIMTLAVNQSTGDLNWPRIALSDMESPEFVYCTNPNIYQVTLHTILPCPVEMKWETTLKRRHTIPSLVFACHSYPMTVGWTQLTTSTVHCEIVIDCTSKSEMQRLVRHLWGLDQITAW